jgi:hypothetical protein
MAHTPPTVTELCRCGAIAYRLLGTVAHCDTCAEEFLAPIRARVILDESGIGRGHQTGPLRPDYGTNWADLTCTVCPYEWTGPIGETCAACIDRAARTVELQRRRLLRPELPPIDDHRRRAAVDAWHGRLARAVVAGIITDVEADSAANRFQVAA